MKTIIAFIFALISSNAFAGNDYCDAQSGHSRAVCYDQAVQNIYRSINKFIKEVEDTTVIPQSKKNEMVRYYAQWDKNIQARCGNSDSCKYPAAKDMAMDLRIKMYDLKIVK